MLLKSLFGSREALAIRSDLGPVSQTPGVIWGGQRSASGARVTELESLSLSAVFAACNLLSSVIGTLPLSVFRQTGRNRNVADTHSANRVLHTQLNPEMTAAVGRRTLEFHRLLWGNCYGEIGWDGGGNVRAIWPLEPWRVKLDRDDNKQLVYTVDGTRKVSPHDMIHVPLVSFDGVRGRSFVDFAIESIGLGMSTQEFAARYFGNGAKPGGVLKHTATPEKGARDRFREEWTKNHGGPGNSNKVAVVWGGWDYVPNDGAFNAQQSQLIEQRRFTIEEVARWFGIPPHMLRELTRSTNNNIEQQGIDLVLYSFGPPLVMYEQEYDRKLLNPPTLYSRHNVAALLRGDSAARSAYYHTMLNDGVYSINDVLGLEDMNPIEGGDTHFVPLNMVPLELAVKGPQPGPGQPPAGGQPGAGAPPGQPKAKPQPAAGDGGGDGQGNAMRALLTDALNRILRVECSEVMKAAARPGKFLDWLDEFYPPEVGHTGRLHMAVAPVLAVCRPGQRSLPLRLARDWAKRSHQELLDLAGEATPNEFATAVQKRLDDWKATRAAEMAAAVMEGNVDAEDAD